MIEKRAALIIASERFEDPSLRQLVAPPKDAEALARVLGDPAVGGFQVYTLLNETSYKVGQDIETFFADRGRDELLVLYFSGHGIKDEDGQLYFATSNTRRDRLRTTAMPCNLISEIMLASRARRQVLLLDCCYSGAFARGMRTKADKGIGTGERFKGRGRVVLTASDAMQYAFEGNTIEGYGVRSMFTHALLRGLETGQADLDGDGDISLDELYHYIYDYVIAETPQQRPAKWVFDVQGSIVIARNPHLNATPAALPPAVRDALQSPLSSVRESAVGELGRLLHARHRGLSLAAKEALKQMLEDDSRRVSSAATAALAADAEATHPKEHGGASQASAREQVALHLEQSTGIKSQGAGEEQETQWEDEQADLLAAGVRIPERGRREKPKPPDVPPDRDEMPPAGMARRVRSRWTVTSGPQVSVILVPTLVTAIGWSIAWLVYPSLFVLVGTSLAFVNSLLVGALSGLAIGLAWRWVEPSVQWTTVSALAACWAGSFSIGENLPYVPHFWWGWNVRVIINATLGACATVLVLRRANPTLHWKQLLMIAGGWAGGWVVSRSISLPRMFLVHDIQFVYPAFLGASIGAVGGGVMFWQLSRRRRKI